MNNIKLALFILLSFSCLSAGTARIMTYNLLNFQDENNAEHGYNPGIDFELDSEFGRIKALDTGELIEGEQYQVSYTFWPIKNSRLFNLEEENPVFDGMKIYLKDEELRLDTQNSGWSSSSNANSVYSITPYNGNNDYMYPADYEVRFSSSIVDTGFLNNILTNFKIFELQIIWTLWNKDLLFLIPMKNKGFGILEKE